MGCAASSAPNPEIGKAPHIKRRSTASVDSSVDVGDKMNRSVKIRQGTPNSFPADGYDIGLRVRV